MDAGLASDTARVLNACELAMKACKVTTDRHSADGEFHIFRKAYTVMVHLAHFYVAPQALQLK